MSGGVKVPDRVKEVAREDFDKAKELAINAVRSAAYLYPFKVRPRKAVHVEKAALTYLQGYPVLLQQPFAMEASCR